MVPAFRGDRKAEASLEQSEWTNSLVRFVSAKGIVLR